MGKKDGLARLHAGHVLVRGRRANVLGNPGLSHCRVDLTEIAEARSGDDVVVIGTDGESEITITDVLRAHPDLDATEVGLEVGRNRGAALRGRMSARLDKTALSHSRTRCAARIHL